MTKYAVTGATGHFGRNALKELVKLVSPSDIVALARNVERAKEIVPEGVEVRATDYNKPEQLQESLQGVDKLLFVSSQPGGPVSRLTQHKNIVLAAKNAGINYIAYTSFPHANIATAPLATDHKATEKLIIESGMKYSFLRNNWYLENETATLKGAANGQPFVYSATGKVGWALEDEYSEAAVKVLVTESPKDVYEFAGPSRSYADLAEAMGNFKVLSLSDEEYRKSLKEAGMDEQTIEIIVSIQDLISDDQLAEDTTDLSDVLGHDLIPIKQAVKLVINK